MKVLEFIQKTLLRVEQQNQQLDIALTVNSVLLRKRFRDFTADDQFSVFNRSGVWKRVESRNLHSLNIIKPMIKTTTAAILTSNVKVVIEPRFVKDTETEMAVQVCHAIRDLKTENQWTSQLQERVATEPQLSPGCFLRVEWNPYAKKHYSVDEWGEDEFDVGGKAVCKACGYETDGMFEADTAICENCGSEAEVIEAPQKEKVDVLKDSQTFKAGDTRTRVIPSAEILIDNKGTQGGNIKAASWMLHRHLEPLGEIKAEYPDCPGDASWSMPLKWQEAMSLGQDEPSSTVTTPDDLTEIKDLYLTPQMYNLEPLDEDFVIKDGGKERFKVKAGQTVGEGSFNGKSFDEPPVLCFRTSANTVVDVYPCDFREEFIYITFLSNPSMFWGLFLTEMLPLQDVVNYMFTVQVFHTKRNARTTKVLNSGVFDAEDVEKDVMLTKDAIPFDSAIGNTFGIIPAVPLNNAPMELISTVLTVKDTIGGLPAAVQGISSPEEPYAAQRQQKEQGMTQLVPFLRSIALAKVDWTKRQLQEAQDNYSEEDFAFLLKLNGDWDEQYIDAFLKCNLETDIIVEYEQGSESPRNLLDREMALRQFMNDVMALSQLNPALAKPEMIDEILLRIKQFTQVDVDVSNTEAEARLADTRYNKIMALIDGMQIPAEAPPEVVVLIANTLTTAPDLMPSQFEDATTEIEFFRDKITKELSQDEPNFLLIACLEQMIQHHMDAATALSQKTAEMEIEASRPQMEMQQEQAMQQQQMQTEQAQMQAEQQAQAGQEQSQQDMQTKMVDAQLSVAEREHSHELKMKEIAAAKKEKANAVK